MKRREFIALVGGAVAYPLVARAQQSVKMKRIAIVHPSEPAANMVAGFHPFYVAIFDELSRHGFVEGKNLIIERYSAEGDTTRFPQLARDVIDTRPDVIYTLEGTLTYFLKSATTTIPIVTIAGDPVATGFARSIAHPGGNITGVSIDAGLEIWGKRFELIKQALPKMSGLGLICRCHKTAGRRQSMAQHSVRQPRP